MAVLNAGFRRRVVSDKDVTQTVHHISEFTVISEEPDDHWIAQDGAGSTPAVDGKIDYAGDE